MPTSTVPRIAVLSVAHDARDARLHRIAAALADLGLQVTTAARGPEEHLPGPSFARVPPSQGKLGRLATALVLPWRARGDVLVTLDPELAVTAWLATRIRHQLLVVDVHEDYRAVLADRPWARGLRRVLGRLGIETMLLAAARADLTVVADDHVPPRHARNRLVVANLPDPSSLPAPSPRGPVPRAIYVGDLRSSRGLDTMLAVLAATPGWQLDLVGPLSDRTPAELAGQLEAHDLVDRVRWHGQLPPGQAWQVAVGAWVGLALLDATPAYKEAMPTKVYEYLCVGLPVLVTDLDRMASFVRDRSVGEVAATPAAAASRLASWRDDPTDLEPMVAAARQWRSEQASRPYPFRQLAIAISDLLP